MTQVTPRMRGNPLLGPADEVEVSVVIPAYNAAATILRAIDSVRAQTGAHCEIIVVNDGSRDDTVAVLSAAIGEGERIELIDLPRNGGVSAARNAGIARARGLYLAFLDADDIWLPGKLEQQLAALRADPGITLISCNSQMTAPSGEPLKEGHVNRPPVHGADAWKTLLIYNFLPTPTVVSYTAMVRDVGAFDVSLAVGEDLDLWIKLGLRGKIAVLPEILINYYDVANSLMKRHGLAAGDIVMPMIEKHIGEQGARLTRGEIRAIRGQRAFQLACDIFFSGGYLPSIRLFLQSARYGARPLKSLSYIPRAIIMEFAFRVQQAIRGRA